MTYEDPALSRCGRPIGCTVRDPIKLAQRLREADDAIRADEDRAVPWYWPAVGLVLMLMSAAVVGLIAWTVLL